MRSEAGPRDQRRIVAAARRGRTGTLPPALIPYTGHREIECQLGGRKWRAGLDPERNRGSEPSDRERGSYIPFKHANNRSTAVMEGGITPGTSHGETSPPRYPLPAQTSGSSGASRLCPGPGLRSGCILKRVQRRRDSRRDLRTPHPSVTHTHTSPFCFATPPLLHPPKHLFFVSLHPFILHIFPLLFSSRKPPVGSSVFCEGVSSHPAETRHPPSYTSFSLLLLSLVTQLCRPRGFFFFFNSFGPQPVTSLLTSLILFLFGAYPVLFGSFLPRPISPLFSLCEYCSPPFTIET